MSKLAAERALLLPLSTNPSRCHRDWHCRHHCRSRCRTGRHGRRQWRQHQSGRCGWEGEGETCQYSAGGQSHATTGSREAGGGGGKRKDSNAGNGLMGDFPGSGSTDDTPSRYCRVGSSSPLVIVRRVRVRVRVSEGGGAICLDSAVAATAALSAVSRAVAAAAAAGGTSAEMGGETAAARSAAVSAADGLASR